METSPQHKLFSSVLKTGILKMRKLLNASRSSHDVCIGARICFALLAIGGPDVKNFKSNQ